MRQKFLIKPVVQALAALLFAALLTLFLARREGGGGFPPPAGAGVPAAVPRSGSGGAHKKAPEPAAAGKGAGPGKHAGGERPVKRRKKRVSRLGEPGDAMGGGKTEKI
ncbi:MAG: hypothetical protein WCW52_11260 [Elusimicrobiales bacterium]